jgi:hypothetical protein
MPLTIAIAMHLLFAAVLGVTIKADTPKETEKPKIEKTQDITNEQKLN